MATMTIDKDVREALDSLKITWAEAGHLMALRRDIRRVERKMTPLETKLNEWQEEFRVLLTLASEIEAKMARTDEEDPVAVRS